MPVAIKDERITVRPITKAEFNALTHADQVYVQDSEFTTVILVPARPVDRLTPFYSGKVELKDAYGSSTYYKPESIYVADPGGDSPDSVDMPLMPSDGRRVTASLYLPGMEDKEIQERVRIALLREFGPGVVELWSLKTQPVRALRWDVFYTRRDLVNGEWVTVEERVAARGVRDGRQHRFMGTEPGPGWGLSIRLHDPNEGAGTEVL